MAEGPLPPWSDEPQVRETRVFVGGKRGGKDKLPGRILTLAGLIITAALIGSAFVGYEAQRLFAIANNHDPAAAAKTADEVRAFIVAALPDLGWVGMALVALVAALRGQSSLRARIGVLVFFALSLGAQILYAPPTPGGILVAVIAPLTMAWMLETWIVEVRRWAAARRNLDITETPILTGVLVTLIRTIRGSAGLLLWCIRLAFDRRGTWKGVQAWVLDTAPLAPGRTLASQRAAEALQLAEGANLTTEQVRQQAAADRLALETQAREDREAAEQLLAQTVQDAADNLAQAKQEAAARVAQIEQRAAARVAQTEEDALARVAQIEQDAARKVAQARDEAERRVQTLTEASAGDARTQADRLHRLKNELETVISERDRVISERDRALAGAQRAHRAEGEVREARTELEKTSGQLDLVCKYAGARAVLRAWYETLKLAGDRRYGDSDAIHDLAHAWAHQVGVTDQTARRYLLEHINDPTAGTNQEGEY